jgi:hypothetical protein
VERITAMRVVQGIQWSGRRKLNADMFGKAPGYESPVAKKWMWWLVIGLELIKKDK